MSRALCSTLLSTSLGPHKSQSILSGRHSFLPNLEMGTLRPAQGHTDGKHCVNHEPSQTRFLEEFPANCIQSACTRDTRTSLSCLIESRGIRRTNSPILVPSFWHSNPQSQELSPQLSSCALNSGPPGWPWAPYKVCPVSAWYTGAHVTPWKALSVVPSKVPGMEAFPVSLLLTLSPLSRPLWGHSCHGNGRQRHLEPGISPHYFGYQISTWGKYTPFHGAGGSLICPILRGAGGGRAERLVILYQKFKQKSIRLYCQIQSHMWLLKCAEV